MAIGLRKVSIEEIAGWNPENQAMVKRAQKALRKMTKRAKKSRARRVAVVADGGPTDLSARPDRPSFGVETPTDRDRAPAGGARDEYEPPETPKGWKKPPKAKPPTFTKGASFNEVLQKSASDRGLLAERDRSAPTNPGYLASVEPSDAPLAKAAQDIVAKSRVPMTELAALEKALRDDPSLADFADARAARPAPESSRDPLYWSGVRKADGAPLGSHRDPPGRPHPSVPIGSLGPIETGRKLPPAANHEAEDITPDAAYDRLMALAEKYADQHDISVAVAFATVADRNPDLFATAKMPQATSRTPAPQ